MELGPFDDLWSEFVAGVPAPLGWASAGASPTLARPAPAGVASVPSAAALAVPVGSASAAATVWGWPSGPGPTDPHSDLASVAAHALAPRPACTPLPARPTSPRALRTKWSLAEDEVLERSVVELRQNWVAVSARIPGRSEDAIRNRLVRLETRWQRVNPSTGSRWRTVHLRLAGWAKPRAPAPRALPINRWKQAEDDMAEQGHRDWVAIGIRLGRTAHAVRNRVRRLSYARRGRGDPPPPLPPGAALRLCWTTKGATEVSPGCVLGPM